MKRSERLHALTDVLRRSGSRGASAERLASEFEVSVRTIKRDLAALESAGLPIWSRPGPGGGYGLVPGASLPPVRLSPTEAMALLAASVSTDAPYADLATAAAEKTVDVLDPRTRQQAERLAERVWVNPSATSLRTTRSALEQAMTDQKVVRIQYVTSEGVESCRDVEPVLFAFTDGRWYLVAWCRLRSAIRWFALSRVKKAVVTSERCSGHDINEVGMPPVNARSVNPQHW